MIYNKFFRNQNHRPMQAIYAWDTKLAYPGPHRILEQIARICYWSVALFLMIACNGLASQSASVQYPSSLLSPDGNIELRLALHVSSEGQGTQDPEFQVLFDGNELLRGELGLCVKKTNLWDRFSFEAAQLRQADFTYAMPFGKNNPVRDNFKELTLDLRSGVGWVQQFQVIFRVYDDGVAYRYVFAEQPNTESIDITDQSDRFHFSGDPKVWPLYRENYTTSHEGIYDHTRFSALAENQLIDVPLLAEFTNGVSVSLTQVSLRNYAGLYFKVSGKGTHRWLRCDLAPLPGREGIKVRSRLPLFSPWCVMLIGNTPGHLIESNLILNLNAPNAIGDTSWLKAGKTTFYWWNGNQEPNDVRKAVQWEKDYIDFCAKHGITFHTVIGTDADHPWYHQTGRLYNPPREDADVTRPRDGFPMEEVTRYARSKGVRIRVWVHWKPLSKHLEEAFTQYEAWGIAGLMVDFLDRNDQQMVNFLERVLQCAARHHLNIQFHGVAAPTGLKRTYPNLFNHEGVLNLEYLKWSDQCTPEHDVTVPFTRMVAGPMDYHLGGFRAAYSNTFKHRHVNPVIMGTRCHQLAMYVVIENPMPMMADTPEAYEGQPGFDFLCEVPTTWNETRVLSGVVGDYIVVARRQGPEWYVGAITDWTPRELTVPLDFLGEGPYHVETWADLKNSKDPNQLSFTQRRISANDTLILDLASGGGQVLHISPIED
jgi:alpha-glucosidase